MYSLKVLLDNILPIPKPGLLEKNNVFFKYGFISNHQVVGIHLPPLVMQVTIRVSCFNDAICVIFLLLFYLLSFC